MELKVKYCKTKELDLEKLLRVIISICHYHKTPCEAKVTLKLDDYPNPVTMVLSEGNQANSENANCAIFDVSQQSELLELLNEIANSTTIYSNTRHKLLAKKILSSNCG